VFVAVTAPPHWLADAGAIFPVRDLASALLADCNPYTTGPGSDGPDLLIVAAWGAAGLLIAMRKFSWLPLPHQPGLRPPAVTGSKDHG
jgi:hypothetical protein